MTKHKNGRTNGKEVKRRKRFSKAEKESLMRDAIRLMKAKHKPLTAKQTAEKIGVPLHWIYYHVGCARDVRAAA